MYISLALYRTVYRIPWQDALFRPNFQAIIPIRVIWLEAWLVVELPTIGWFYIYIYIVNNGQYIWLLMVINGR